MQIQRIDAETVTDDDIPAIHELWVAAAAHDRPQDPPPPLSSLVMRLRVLGPDRRFVHVVARDGGAVLGHAFARLSLTDNLHLSMVDVRVHPRHRRQGIGSALLRELLVALAAEDRPVLLAESDAGPAGDGFAAALGVKLVQASRMSLLRMADVDWADVTALAAADHPGYRLEAYDDRVPDELLDGYARAKTAMNDAPVDDADFGDVAYSAEILRAEWDRARGMGQPRVVFARHSGTGDIAAFTEVQVEEPPRSHQEDTAVVPAHRGSGLGLWVKAEMLVRLRAGRPEVTELLTGNASSNRFMLAVNDRLGYRLWSEINGWQGDVAELSARLG